MAARAAAALVFALPLALAVPLALGDASDAAAWHALWADLQLGPALGLSLFSAAASTLLALMAALWLTTRLHGSALWPRLAAALGPMLAVPHAAFAIGLAWLLAPTGLFARALAPVFGWVQPPAWATVNDPAALGLTVTLALKELPFLLWSAVALLARPELAARLAAERHVAASLGYGATAWWWRAGWPQLLPLLAWPLLAVFAYGLTVVDLALIIGPGQPPTAAALAYADLQSADPARSARGTALAVVLAVLLALGVAVAWGMARGLRRAHAAWALQGQRPTGRAARGGGGALALLAAVYAAVLLVLALLSVAGPWPFPRALPQAFSGAGWQQVAASLGTLGFTAALAAGATAAALLLTVAWLEATPAHWDRRVAVFVLAPLVLPPLLLMAGLYRGALHLGLDGQVAGLLWGHTLVVLPYVFIVLQPAWRDLDPRWRQTALALGRSRWAFRWQVQRPLLAAPLAAAAAVGVAVSVGQFLATQMLGAGRHPTVATEAVTLASGGDRRTAAAYALLQALLPMAAFAAARRWR